VAPLIEFPCVCGFVFRLPDDQAGGLTQCPDCRRLNDVPTFSELGQIAPDGTYRVDTSPPPKPADDAADLTYIYRRGARDAEGNEIDLRLTDEELSRAGHGDPIPISSAVERQERAPRYDPETGELISPFDVMPGDERLTTDPESIPIAKPALGYATGPAANRPTFLRLFLQLLSPINMAVLLAVFVVHALLWPLLMVLFAGILLMLIAVPVLAGLILSHYGNVIEETGPYGHDELPRPLRNLGWHEDIWSPFVGVFGSLLICYGPALWIPQWLHRHAGPDSIGLGLAIVLAAAGTFFFPAVLLTLQTSGTSLNLRPDRLLGVISGCGKDYFLTVVLWVPTLLLYLLGWVGTSLAMATLVRQDVHVPFWMTSWAVVGPALGAGIFLAHYYCMALGMLYRKHYEKFPWILQRHISTRTRNKPGLPPNRQRRRPPGASLPAKPQ